MRIVFASDNQDKFVEVSDLFAEVRTASGKEIELIRQSSLAVLAAEETAPTFVENAILKARNASRYTGLPALADDSGLEVPFLKGAPGVHSARYAGPRASYRENVAKLLLALDKVPEAKRLAQFQCVLVFLRYAEDPMPIICNGSWPGKILTEAYGNYGFGYDPIFFVPEHNCSAAELSMALKNQISHRALALRKFLEFITHSAEF